VEAIQDVMAILAGLEEHSEWMCDVMEYVLRQNPGHELASLALERCRKARKEAKEGHLQARDLQAFFLARGAAQEQMGLFEGNGEEDPG
jgi:hypothetical protein